MFFLNELLFFRCFFSRLVSMGQLLSAHETHVPTTHAILLHQRFGRMASCGPPPPCAAATPAAAAAAAAAATRAAATPGAAAITLRQHPLSSKDNASTSSDILAAASHATAAAVIIPDSASTHMKVNVAATCCQKMSTVCSKLHRRFRQRDEPGQERYAACIAETARMVVCTPTTVPRR